MEDQEIVENAKSYLDEAMEEMLKDGGNPEKAFDYMELCIEDLETVLVHGGRDV